jgi:hypothetical protein
MLLKYLLFFKQAAQYFAIFSTQLCEAIFKYFWWSSKTLTTFLKQHEFLYIFTTKLAASHYQPKHWLIPDKQRCCEVGAI